MLHGPLAVLPARPSWVWPCYAFAFQCYYHPLGTLECSVVHAAHSNMAAACSFKEQLAVEGCFLTKGTLLPTFHKFYWMGLRSGAVVAICCLSVW
jgi:hypothetical protein